MSRPLDTFFVWLLQVLLLSLLLLFFLWLSLRPSPPSYEIVDFSVDTNDSSISFSVEFSNDNRGGSVYYGNITVTVYKGDNDSVVVGVVILPSFSQGHEKSTVVTGKVKGNAAMGQLKVGMAVTVRYRVWWWRSKVHGVDVEAGVKVGRDGRLSAKEKKKIKMYKANNNKKKKKKNKWCKLMFL